MHVKEEFHRFLQNNPAKQIFTENWNKILHEKFLNGMSRSFRDYCQKSSNLRRYFQLKKTKILSLFALNFIFKFH